MAMPAASVKPTSAADLTRSWIAIPSESSDPVASDAQAPEAAMARAIAERCQAAGIEHRLDEVAAGRWNMVARMPRPGAPRVLIAGHLDTVSARGMDQAFVAERSGGSIRGRGACDDKGPFAAAIAAVHRLLAEGRRPEVDLTLLGTADEEAGMIGARHWAKAGSEVDMILALEPTGLRRVIAHKGVYRCRIDNQGRACHSARPELGLNAIETLLPDLLGVVDEGRVLAEHSDPLLGRSTLQVTGITGGTGINIVPGHCSALVDVRLISAVTPEETARRLAKRCVCGAITEIFSAPALAARAAAAGTGERFRAALRSVGVERGEEVAPWCSDASFLQQLGPAIVWGPGRIEDAHTKDECISVEELEQATDTLVAFLGTSA
jgi:succinyl-diaminopimelate desuccinylase